MTAQLINAVTQLPVGLIVRLVERCTGVAEVMRLNLVQAWILFSLKFHNCWSEMLLLENTTMATKISCALLFWVKDAIWLTFETQFFACSLLFSPSHVNPSPVNPFLHEQLYDPSVLLQVAFPWQSFIPCEHSSTSVKNFNYNFSFRPKIFAFLQIKINDSLYIPRLKFENIREVIYDMKMVNRGFAKNIL